MGKTKTGGLQLSPLMSYQIRSEAVALPTIPPLTFLGYDHLRSRVSPRETMTFLLPSLKCEHDRPVLSGVPVSAVQWLRGDSEIR